MHMSTELFSSVWMALQGEFSLDFSHIRPIILKSNYYTFAQPIDMYNIELFWQQYTI